MLSLGLQSVHIFEQTEVDKVGVDGNKPSTGECLEILLKFVIDIEDPDSILLSYIVHVKLTDLLKSTTAV